MIKIIIIYIISLLFFTSCKLSVEQDINMIASKNSKERISYKQLTPILESNNYEYIKQILENYDINLNEVKSGFTILDKYETILDKKIVNLLKNYNAKNYHEILEFKIKNSCLKNCKRSLNRYIYDNNKLPRNSFLKILDDNYSFLEFLLKKGFNPNKQIFKKTLFNISNIRNHDNGSLLDNMTRLNNKKAIELLKQYGAKRLCEIKGKKCDSIIIKYENKYRK